MPKFIIKTKHNQQSAPLYFRSPGQGLTRDRAEAYEYDSASADHIVIAKEYTTKPLNLQKEYVWVVVPV